VIDWENTSILRLDEKTDWRRPYGQRVNEIASCQKIWHEAISLTGCLTHTKRSWFTSSLPHFGYAFHTCTVPSLLDEAMWLPSGDQVRPLTWPW
jgi:hypothetical protein